MHQTHQPTVRRNILVGLAMGSTALAVTGCGAPQPASLENSGMAGMDYNKLDYNKLDYSKLDYSKLDPQQMGDVCELEAFSGAELSAELQDRLMLAYKNGVGQQVPESVLKQIEGTIVGLQEADQLFAKWANLCW